ncbi:ketoacyl-ACP synthase III [Streptomyces sp. AD681]|uniref:3-oxoacyl-ACP synthase III family protein n=1 Tax=Streptomyces sp. AD681 TaxID=3019069 RepID=UPI0022F14F2D|nr:ketoacyl-ACP synthase III [Streptomyces sp. AD681]MDA5142599.1 ketoacyl-ACP synthase III [Streptomyces sp. AD681]
MNGQPVGILATGSYVPKEEVGNEEVAQRVGATAEWIERKTHIRGRHWAAPDEAASDLGARAAEDALARAGLDARRVDFIIVSTGTGDSPQPPTACLVQNALGASEAACFDISVACSGFVYGLELARALLQRRPQALALVISTEVYSRFANFADRRTAVLLGDGAAAAVVGAVPEGYGIVASDLSSRGDAHELLRIEAGGSRLPASHATVDAGAHHVSMDGRGVRDFVLENVPPVLTRLVGAAGLDGERIDHFVPHQPNGVLVDQLADATGLRIARTHRTVEKYANVGSASVPLTLDDANRAGLIGQGDLVLLAGFGGGMAVGACVMRWAVAA